MAGRTNQKEQETTCVGRDWKGQKKILIKGIDRNPVHAVHRDLPGMESAAEFGYPNASEIAQPQESEEHV